MTLLLASTPEVGIIGGTMDPSKNARHRVVQWVCICVLTLGMLSVGYRPVMSRGVILTPESRIAFAARVDGNWDIYSIRDDGSGLRRITIDPAEDRAPAFSPDGTKLAFQSRRTGNWEVFVLDLASSEMSQLTDGLAYDGMPTWSPDGQAIAFESTRNGDLDIFVMSASGENPVNLTSDSPSGEIEPAWSPDGQRIAFATWREQDKDIYTMAPDGSDLTQLTKSTDGEDQPAWSPNGSYIIFTARTPERREISHLSVVNPPAQDGLTTRLTWTTANEWPTWSPAGDALAWLEQRYNGWALNAAPLAEVGGLPDVVVEGRALAGPLSWSSSALPFGNPVSPDSLQTRQRQEKLVRWLEVEDQERQPTIGWERLPDVKAPNDRMNALVASSLVSLREAIREATGWDFLSELSDAWRPLDARSDTSSYLSWHKTGRAVDFLMDYRARDGFPYMEVIREEIGGETFWRVYLRCRRQDGSQGSPLREHSWDFSGAARTRNPELGGRWNMIPVGYYVDITDLADVHGWDRIAAIDRADYSWKWHLLAVDYWHFQYDEGLSWYSALQQVYSEEELAGMFSWQHTKDARIAEWRIVYTGIPVPISERRWAYLRP